MKKLVFLLTIIISQTLMAQNVGIGTATPQAKLHISSTSSSELLRLDGASPILSLYTNGTNAGFLQMGPSGVELGSVPGTLLPVVFAPEGVPRMYIRPNGFVGIGINLPQASLDVARGVAGSVTANFHGSTHISHFNFGTDEHTFIRAGKDNGNVILNDINGGRVGIGVADPGVKLDIGGRIKIRTGTDGEAGIWLNKTDNTNIAAFMGLENDTYVGFYGAGAGWKFAMNTQTGALKINGSEGTAGQVLRSNGSGGAPVWGYANSHYIGESYGGGIVFYVYDNGQHGLIAATADQSTGIQWNNGSYTTTNAVRDQVNAGLLNTERIIINQGSGSYAAQICANYQGGGYGDWYLPSKYELNLLYLQKTVVGGFASVYYWSSSEFENSSSASSAWYQYFLAGFQGFELKNNAYRVRAVRAF